MGTFLAFRNCEGYEAPPQSCAWKASVFCSDEMAELVKIRISITPKLLKQKDNEKTP